MGHRKKKDLVRSGNYEPVSGRGLIGFGPCHLIQDGVYFVGWVLLGVVKFDIAAVPESYDFPLER